MDKNLKNMSGETKFMLGIGLTTVLVFAGIILSADKQSEKLSIPLAGEEQPIKSSQHVVEGAVEQLQDPPTSGNHYGNGVAGPGIHKEPVEDGLTVHSMEHGAVVLHYDPNQLDEGEQNQLDELFKTEIKGKKIMMPRENMSSPIILTSWGQILKLGNIERTEIINFFEANNDRGPEKVSSY